MLQGEKGSPRHQWFWIGNQEQTGILTPDIKHTIKRHIVVTRVITDEDFPIGRKYDTIIVQEVVEESKNTPLKARPRFPDHRLELDDGHENLRMKMEDKIQNPEEYHPASVEDVKDENLYGHSNQIGDEELLPQVLEAGGDDELETIAVVEQPPESPTKRTGGHNKVYPEVPPGQKRSTRPEAPSSKGEVKNFSATLIERTPKWELKDLLNFWFCVQVR